MGSSIVIRFCLCAFLELFAVLAGTSSIRPLTKIKKSPRFAGLPIQKIIFVPPSSRSPLTCVLLSLSADLYSWPGQSGAPDSRSFGWF